MKEKECSLKPTTKLELVCGEKTVIDEELARILYSIKTTKSLLRTSKILGIPYSKLWEKIHKVEGFLGEKIVERWKGGVARGGSRLTPKGEELLETYMRYYKIIMKRSFESIMIHIEEPSFLVFMGSHDLLLETVFDEIIEYRIDPVWTGSIAGLLNLANKEADIGGVHYPEDMGGPEKLLEILGLKGTIRLIPGFMRRQGIISRKPLTLKEIIHLIREGQVVLAVRNIGSGTRILFEELISKWTGSGSLVKELIKNSIEANTHKDTCKLVAFGQADLGLTIEPVARLYGLYFVPITWERYSLAVNMVDSENSMKAAYYIVEKSKVVLQKYGLVGYRIDR